MTTAVVFNFVRVSENICTICLENFHRVWKVSPQCRCLLNTFDHKHLRQPVLVVQFPFEASDLATEVTPKASSTCENEAEGVQRKPSTKRALFSDQFSELEDEITSPISRASKNLRRTSFRLTSRLSRCSLFSLIPGKNCRATKSRFEVVAFHDHIEINI